MNLKWTRERSYHYCYDGDSGRILAEVYEHTLTSHCTASLVLLETHTYEPFGSWISPNAAKKAIEFELQLRNERELEITNTIGIC